VVPAALENQIGLENVDVIKARIIAEAANGSTTDADEALHQRGIMVIPDILVNVGVVTVSHFEWDVCKNFSGMKTTSIAGCSVS
jgi:glutamate dehydrogenase